MIGQEIINGFRRTWSDENYYIQKVGTDKIYSEAWDVLGMDFEYVETTEKIEVVEEVSEEEY